MSEGPADATPGDDPCALYRELRLALVINGGVSLAIWMGGAVKEIDRFRCAFRRRDADAADARLYRALLEAVRTEVTTDVLAGTSAGGINATLLAYAVANGRSLESAGANAIRDLWVRMGALRELRYDDGEPASALRGEEVLYAQCVGMFRALQEAEPDLDVGADRRARLSVTASDTAGFPLQVEGTSTRDHRVLMRFRHTARPTPSELLVSPELRALAARLVGKEVPALSWPFPERRLTRDLTHDDAPLYLARAARSTSAFPLAFAPSTLPFGAPGDPVNGRDDLATPPMDEIVDSPAHAPVAPLADAEGKRRRYVIDGGVWDNSPFGAVLDGIDRSPSSREVRRKLTYVVGIRDPHEQTSPGVKPGLIGAFTEAFGTPADLSFTSDLERIGADLEAQRVTDTNLPRLLLGEGIDVCRVAQMLYPAYRERVRAEALAAARAVVQAAPVPTDVDVSVPVAPRHPCLPADAAGAPLAAWGAEPSDWQWGIGPVRRKLQDGRDALRDVLHVLMSGYEPAADAVALARTVAEARSHYAQLVWLLDDLAALLDERAAALRPANLQEAVTGAWSDEARALCGGAMAELASVAGAVAADLGAYADAHPELGPAGAGELALARELGAGGPEQIVRRALAVEIGMRTFAGSVEQRPRYSFTTVRPGSTWVLGDATPRPGLAGGEFHHFGAFLRASWRAHDWMWGRIDGATQVIDMLVDAEQLQRLTAGRAADARELARALAAVAIPDCRDAESYARARRIASQAYAARRLDGAATGPDSTRATGPGVDFRALVGDWRLALGAALADDVVAASAPAGDAGALARIRADLHRPFAHLIAWQEVPFVHRQSLADGGGTLAAVDELLAADDVGLRALAPANLCTWPDDHELRQQLADAVSNVARAEHHGLVSSLVSGMARVVSRAEHIAGLFD